ncbi:hypothetical protein [Rhodoblastus sp.]|uniref:hypothetical protein n=1 Tax=Rhodoblastus sp. TaxID=1962975 RepID=UPI003F998B07
MKFASVLGALLVATAALAQESPEHRRAFRSARFVSRTSRELSLKSPSSASQDKSARTAPLGIPLARTKGGKVLLRFFFVSGFFPDFPDPGRFPNKEAAPKDKGNYLIYKVFHG